jgi:CO/xanthine dehydrogenase FAD-binding subunit
MNVLMPTTLREACELMSRHAGGLVPLAGATDLLVHWPLRQADHDRTYLDLGSLAELRPIAWLPDSLRLGALTTYWDVLNDALARQEFPVLIEAARQVGAIQIQSRGTWAGNIANASPAADGVPVLMACDASIELISTGGTRSVTLADYYLGYKKTVRRADELISAITIPRRAYDLAVFEKVGARRAQAITKVGLAITRAAGQGPSPWRIVASSAAPTIRRCRAVESLLESGRKLTSPAAFDQAVRADVSPIDDIRSTAEYRRTVLCRLLYHALVGRCPSVV